MGEKRESNSHRANQTEFQNSGADFARRHGRFDRRRLSRKHFSADNGAAIRKLFLTKARQKNQNVYKCHI